MQSRFSNACWGHANIPSPLRRHEFQSATGLAMRFLRKKSLRKSCGTPVLSLSMVTLGTMIGMLRAAPFEDTEKKMEQLRKSTPGLS